MERVNNCGRMAMIVRNTAPANVNRVIANPTV